MWVFKDALPYLLGPATNTFCELMLLDGDAQENEGFAASPTGGLHQFKHVGALTEYTS